MKIYVYVWYYRSEFVLEWKMLQEKSCRENENTHFMFTVFFPKILPFMR